METNNVNVMKELMYDVSTDEDGIEILGEPDMTHAEAEKLVIKHAELIKYRRAMRSFAYYTANQICEWEAFGKIGGMPGYDPATFKCPMTH